MNAQLILIIDHFNIIYIVFTKIYQIYFFINYNSVQL